MSSRQSSPTLDDVAKLAGVSTATVSRCWNSPDLVVEKTRKRVLVAVEDLGYTPNFGARVMAAKRTFTIGALIPTMENAIFARGLQAFQEELNARGYTLLVSSTGYKPEMEKDQIRTLVGRGADGLLLIGYERDPTIHEYLERQNVPFLVSWAYSEAERHPSVGFDNRASMRCIAQEVLNQGHTKIGMIASITADNDRAFQRVEGVKDVLRNAGHDISCLAIEETSNEIESGKRACETLLTRAPETTALICGNDVLAVGALLRAKELGLQVPEDVSITGFDDMELAQIVSPSITTMHVPHREMGRLAAIKLTALVEERKEGESVELKSHLKIRESLGAPRSYPRLSL